MLKMPSAYVFFAVLGVIFLVLASLDFRRHGLKSTPARKAWLRIGLIFSAVSVYLLYQGGSR
jgi:hypothetical protein